MSLVDKSLGKFGVLAAMETTTYGSGTPALSASTDGVKVYEVPEVEMAMQFNGARDGETGTGAQQLTPVLPAARSGKFSMMHYFKGPGVAYSASVRCSMDRLLRMAGLQATFSGGAGSEIVTYIPIALDQVLTSGVAEVYNRGQKYPFKGLYIPKFVIASNGLAVPKCTFDAQGIISAAPTDSAVPAITAFAPAVKNPKASALGLALVTGAQTYTPRLKDFTFTFEREVSERVDLDDSAGAHVGFHLGNCKATLDLIFEATPVVVGSPYASSTAFDVYRVFENMGDVHASLTIGGTQYNKLKIDAATAHLSDFAKEEREGPIALWNASFQCDPSTEELLDMFSLVSL